MNCADTLVLQGCNWHSFETSAASQTAQWDAATYKKLGKVAELYPDLCQRIPFKDLWSKRVPVDGIWFSDLVGGVSEAFASSSALSWPNIIHWNVLTLG